MSITDHALVFSPHWELIPLGTPAVGCANPAQIALSTAQQVGSALQHHTFQLPKLCRNPHAWCAQALLIGITLTGSKQHIPASQNSQKAASLLQTQDMRTLLVCSNTPTIASHPRTLNLVSNPTFRCYAPRANGAAAMAHN